MKANSFNKRLLIALITSLIIILLSSQILSHNHKKSSRDSGHSKNKNKKSNNHSHSHKHSHSHSHSHSHNQLSKDTFVGYYVQKSMEYLESKMENITKEKQAYIGAFIISSASLPVFLIIMIFNIKSIVILNIFSAFAAGALVGDVFMHNLPEILHTSHENTKVNFFTNKETLLGLGLISLFAIEKIIKLLYRSMGANEKVHHHNKKSDENSHSHSCIGHGNSENVILSIIGDIIHNITDGMAIGAAFSTNLKLGITLTMSIFFHEIPHEVGDFTFLLKQKLSKLNALTTQIFSAAGAFIGVYLSFVIGDSYSLHILSFASGAFLYLAINTILGDIKEPNSIIDVITEMIAFIMGFYVLFIII